jgi:hypothetical protein
MFKDVKMDDPGFKFTTEGWSWKPPADKEEVVEGEKDK